MSSPLKRTLSQYWANDAEFNSDMDSTLWANEVLEMDTTSWEDADYVNDLEQQLTYHEAYYDMMEEQFSTGFTPSLADQLQNLGSSHSTIGSTLSFSWMSPTMKTAIQNLPSVPLNRQDLRVHNETF